MVASAMAGQLLLDLNIGYEDIDTYGLDEQISAGAPAEPEQYRVERMLWGGPSLNPDRSRIIHNDWITLASTPN